MFDASSLVQAVMDQQMATSRPLVPEGEYPGVTEEINAKRDFRLLTSDNNKPNENGCDCRGVRLVFDLNWNIDDPAVAASTHFAKNTVRQTLYLDVVPGSDLEAGRFSLAGGDEWNLGLGRTRKIFGQNENGKSWGFSMLAGHAARVTVTHSKSGENEYANVTKVVAL